MGFNFVDEFLKITRLVESPTSYLRWAAYVTVGATLRHNVYYSFPSRRTKVTPNLYVLLVGDSGSTRKSTPLKLANFMLRSVNNTKLIEGRTSIQGAMKEMAEMKKVDKVMIKDASCLLYSEELAAFLVKDPSTSGILTDIYDYKDKFDIILKSTDSMTLRNVAISMLSATNAAFIQDMFNKTDLYGGLVGRTFFIMEERARHKDLGLRDTVTVENWDPLIGHLKKLARLEGPVTLEENAICFLEEWYNQTDFSSNESKTGYEHRAHTHVLKLALILAACNQDFDLTVKQSHCEEALQLVVDLRKNYHKLVATVGFTSNDVQQAIKDITAILFSNPNKPYTKQSILQFLFGRIDSQSFDKAITTLQEAKLVELKNIGGLAGYTLTNHGHKLILGEMRPSSIQ